MGQLKFFFYCFFFHLYIFNQDLRVSMGAPRLIPEPIYYFFLILFCSLVHFLWPGSLVQLKCITTNSRTVFFFFKYELQQCFHACIFSHLYFFLWSVSPGRLKLLLLFTYTYLYNQGLWIRLSVSWLILRFFFL